MNARDEQTPKANSITEMHVELKYLDPIDNPGRLILQGEQLAEYANAFLKEHAGKPIYAFVYFEENGTVEISYGPVPDEIMLSRAYLAMVSVPSKLAKPGQKPEAPFVEIIKATRGAASVILTADVPVKHDPDTCKVEKCPVCTEWQDKQIKSWVGIPESDEPDANWTCVGGKPCGSCSMCTPDVNL